MKPVGVIILMLNYFTQSASVLPRQCISNFATLSQSFPKVAFSDRTKPK